MRIKTKDNTEFLYSKGNLISYDGLGDEVKHYLSMPEKWLKTNFVYEKDWDPKRKTILSNCIGPGTSEDAYTLEFNEANLKSLFDKRENDYIGWIVKELLNYQLVLIIIGFPTFIQSCSGQSSNPFSNVYEVYFSQRD